MVSLFRASVKPKKPKQEESYAGKRLTDALYLCVLMSKTSSTFWGFMPLREGDKSVAEDGEEEAG